MLEGSLSDIIRLGYYRYWNPVIIHCRDGAIIGSFLFRTLCKELFRKHSNRIATMLLSQFLVNRSLIQLSSTPIQIRDNLKTQAFYQHIHSVFRF